MRRILPLLLVCRVPVALDEVVGLRELLTTAFRAEEAVAFVPVALRTTVVVLASLESLALLRRRVRVGGRAVCALEAVVGFLALMAVVGRDGAVDAASFLELAARAALAFSTMLERTLVAVAEREAPLRGDPGRLEVYLLGDCSWRARRELEEVGERTWPGRTDAI